MGSVNSRHVYCYFLTRKIDKVMKLLEIIPEEEKSLREAIQETDDQRATLMAFIGWPTDEWHWKALSAITGKTYEQLQAEMEPYN